MASCLIRGTVAIDGMLGQWPATKAVGGRLTPIFSRAFVAFLAEHTNNTVADKCGCHPDTVQRWRATADKRGMSKEGRLLCGKAAQFVVSIRAERKLPAKDRRVEIARLAALAKHRRLKSLT